MPLKIKLKLDPNVIRLYITANSATSQYIQERLENKSYTNITESIKKTAQEVRAYALKDYSMAYRIKRSNETHQPEFSTEGETICLEARLKVRQLERPGQTLACVIENLTRPIKTHPDSAQNAQKTSVSELKDYHLIEVFKHSECSLDEALQLITALETLVKNEKKANGLSDWETISSELTFNCSDTVPTTHHIEGIRLFGPVNTQVTPKTYPIHSNFTPN